jgi:hypothetical protein
MPIENGSFLPKFSIKTKRNSSSDGIRKKIIVADIQQ